jgi:hypothetical protein
MDWSEAESKIRTMIKVGTDLNTAKSTYRFVKAIDSVTNSERYGYHNERGCVVSIGEFNDIRITWGLLRECFSQFNSPRGYDRVSFTQRFPLQSQDHPCHIHVVGQIFVRAGVARTNGSRYQLL